MPKFELCSESERVLSDTEAGRGSELGSELMELWLTRDHAVELLHEPGSIILAASVMNKSSLSV